MSEATLLPDRALLRLSGEDVRGFLQGLVTQDMAAVTPGAPQWAGLLTAQGKALFDFILWEDGDSILIDCEAGQREALARRLTLYRLRRAIVIEPAEGGVHWSPDGERGVPDPRLPELGRRWLGAAEGATATAWRAHRLSLGVTEGAAELGQDKTLWLEANAAELNGVSFTKGCYIGQENTARMHYRAKVNRRLVVAPLGEQGERTRAAYPELGLMVELRRVEALGDALVPGWLAAALSSS
ncbi:MAG: folate-binding protein [Pseudomonadota bacterium]